MEACHPRQQLYWKIASMMKHMYFVVIGVVGSFRFCLSLLVMAVTAFVEMGG